MVNLVDKLLPEPTMDALDERYIREEHYVKGDAGKNYRVVSCVIRPNSSGVWGVIDDGIHTPVGVSAVTQTSGAIEVHYNFTAKRIGSLVATPDETFAQSGLQAGASVQETVARIQLGWTVTGDRVFWNGSAWTSSHDNFSAYSFNSATGVLTCTRRGQYSFNIGVAATSRKPNMHVFLDGVNPTQVRVGFSDMAGAPVTSPSTDCDAYLVVPARQSAPIDPSTLKADVYSGANIWVFGIFEVD